MILVLVVVVVVVAVRGGRPYLPPYFPVFGRRRCPVRFDTSDNRMRMKDVVLQPVVRDLTVVVGLLIDDADDDRR